MNARTRATVVAAALAVLTGCGTGGGAPAATGGHSASSSPPSSASSSPSSSPSSAHRPAVGSPAGVPTPGHVMVVIFENEDAHKVVGAPDAPYLSSLASAGAGFTNAHGVAHPSQPNYLALFSGSTHGVTDDSCPQALSGPNLASELAAAGRTFVGYSEDLPSEGYTGCRAGGYARKHDPWVDFRDLPASVNQPYSALPADLADLPTVSFVVPNLCDDMHDCGVASGDRWAHEHLPAYVAWAQQHDSLLVVTFDEDNGSAANHIATVLVGPMVTPGTYDQRIDHYSVLRTLEDMYGLTHAGQAATAAPLTGLWRATTG